MRDFLKQTFASLLGNLIGLSLFFGLGTAGLIFLAVLAASQDNGPNVRNKSVLIFDLSLRIADTPPSSTPLEDALYGEIENVTTLRTVLDSLEEAAEDKRIVGLYLKGSNANPGNGFATLKEVREALQRFRDTGKPILAYDTDWEEREYYLSSVANTIAINPLGLMEFDGFSSELTFYGGAFQKYGIGVQALRAGKYKAAVEPFLQTKRSPENRQQTQQLLNDFWNEFSSTIGKSRKRSPQQLQQIADNQGILLPEEALQRKLVDKVEHFDWVVSELKQLTGQKEKDKSFRKISLPTYARATGHDKTEAFGDRIAVIYAEGIIVDGKGSKEEIGGDRLAKELRKLRLNKNVKAVVLRVNSPGGSATASEVIQREVALIRKQKPLVVSMGNVAASGGYWISTDADRIFAEPTTITGSIGVFGLFLNIQEFANNQGITWDTVTTARFASSQTLSRPRTKAELERYQKVVDRVYDRFLEKVAKTRKLSKQKVDEIAQGRVWSGLAAKRIGLVDEIGGLEAAILYAAEKGELGDNWDLEEYPKNRSWEERLLESLGADSALTQPDPLTEQWVRLREDLAILETLNDPLGAYARLPYNLRID